MWNKKQFEVWLEKHGKKAAFATTAVVVLACCLWKFWYGHEAHDDTWHEVEQAQQANLVESPSAKTEVVVHVAGAVEKPGVYTLSEGARVYEAIDKAIATTEADLDALNLAQMINDGEKIVVPLKGESPVVTAENHSLTSQKVNLNTADKSTLMTLSGIGEKRAEDIIAYRERNGRFSSIEQLKEVSGIGPKTFDALADQITV